MSKLFDQIERWAYKHGKRTRGDYKWEKKAKHRIERRRAKREPDCIPCYRKYAGWWF